LPGGLDGEFFPERTKEGGREGGKKEKRGTEKRWGKDMQKADRKDKTFRLTVITVAVGVYFFKYQNQGDFNIDCF
jgi:hypothetical protein